MGIRRRYPGIRVDISDLGSSPVLDGWTLVPDDRGDGAVLTGTVTGYDAHPDGTEIVTRTVQAIDADEGWVWTYGMGLIRLGRHLDPEGAEAVEI